MAVEAVRRASVLGHATPLMTGAPADQHLQQVHFQRQRRSGY